jgi:hypothetical protein
MAISIDSLKLVDWPKAAMIPVIVVPIFDPSVSGKTRSRLMTPKPTSGTKLEVNTELLCKMNVKPHPSYFLINEINLACNFFLILNFCFVTYNNANIAN